MQNWKECFWTHFRDISSSPFLQKRVFSCLSCFNYLRTTKNLLGFQPIASHTPLSNKFSLDLQKSKSISCTNKRLPLFLQFGLWIIISVSTNELAERNQRWWCQRIICKRTQQLVTSFVSFLLKSPLLPQITNGILSFFLLTCQSYYTFPLHLFSLYLPATFHCLPTWSRSSLFSCFSSCWRLTIASIISLLNLLTECLNIFLLTSCSFLKTILPLNLTTLPCLLWTKSKFWWTMNKGHCRDGWLQPEGWLSIVDRYNTTTLHLLHEKLILYLCLAVHWCLATNK